jgi:hypothetical protein
MALVLADRVRDTTTTTGTGTVTLSGTAPTGYQTFGAAIGNTNTTYYTINAGSQWEVGLGTYSSTGPTLARTTVLSSSNGGSLVDFSTGTKDVFVTYPAEKSINEDASGNVGIGTASPNIAGVSRAVTVNTTNASSGAIYEIAANGTNYAYLFANASNTVLSSVQALPLLFSTTNTERMRIDSSGNVGIGTSSPSAKLYVNGGVAIHGASFPTSGVGIEALWDGTQSVVQSYNRNTSTYQPLRFDGSALQLFTSGTEKARIDSSGNVGIGTSSPAGKLHTVSTSAFASPNLVCTDGVSNFRIVFNTGAYAGVPANKPWLHSYDDMYIGSDATTSFNVISGGVNRFIVDSSGNLLVGTTSATNTPSQGITLMQNTNIGSIGIGHASGTADGNGYLQFAFNGSSIGSVTQSGSGTAVLYNVTSDSRLKKNIADADNASSLIDALQVRKFDWKANGEHQRYGFIAQELLEVAPEAVSQPTDPDDMMGVDYSKLVPMLIKEVQSLRARVAQLEGN